MKRVKTHESEYLASYSNSFAARDHRTISY
jgi:hypothetical protein